MLSLSIILFLNSLRSKIKIKINEQSIVHIHSTEEWPTKDIVNILTLDTQYLSYVCRTGRVAAYNFDQNTKCIVNNGVLISLGGKKGEWRKKEKLQTTGNLIQHLLPPHKENDA